MNYDYFVSRKFVSVRFAGIRFVQPALAQQMYFLQIISRTIYFKQQNENVRFFIYICLRANSAMNPTLAIRWESWLGFFLRNKVVISPEHLLWRLGLSMVSYYDWNENVKRFIQLMCCMLWLSLCNILKIFMHRWKWRSLMSFAILLFPFLFIQ